MSRDEDDDGADEPQSASQLLGENEEDEQGSEEALNELSGKVAYIIIV